MERNKVVDALANADRIVSSLGSLLLEGAGSDICGVLVTSRTFLGCALIGTLDIVLNLEEKLGALQGWKLSRRGRFSIAWREVNSDLHRRRRCCTDNLSSEFIEAGLPIRASTDIREAARRCARFIENLITRDEKWILESER